MQQILKDARMRESADRVRAELARMMDDVGRLRERAQKLHGHFHQASEDVRQVLISTEKIEKRAGRIEELEFDAEGDAGEAASAAAAAARGVGGGERGEANVIPAPIGRKA
jgi:DNA recombination protein RmuC